MIPGLAGSVRLVAMRHGNTFRSEITRAIYERAGTTATERVEIVWGNSDYERVIFLTRSGSPPFVPLHTISLYMNFIRKSIYALARVKRQEFCIFTLPFQRV